MEHFKGKHIDKANFGCYTLFNVIVHENGAGKEGIFMHVTTKLIAELAGVSRGTVDRALNSRGGVNKEVAEKVIRIANELGYKPNIVAKSLSNRGKGNTKIGVIINSIGNPFYNDVMKGIYEAQTEIKDFGFEVEIIKLRGYEEKDQIKAIERLVASKVAGIIISPINTELVINKLKSVIESGIPVVAVNSDIEKVDRLAYIGCDYLKSGRTAGGILGLFTKGNAKVGVVIGSPFVLGHRQRAQGFYQVIEQEFKGISIIGEVQNNDSEEISYQVVKKFLEENPEVNALYFTTGGVKGGMKAVRELKKQDELHIVTCDLTPVVEENIKKGIIDATICQQPFRQGFGIVKLLFDYLIANEKPSKDVIHTEIEIKLKYNLSDE